MPCTLQMATAICHCLKAKEDEEPKNYQSTTHMTNEETSENFLHVSIPPPVANKLLRPIETSRMAVRGDHIVNKHNNNAPPSLICVSVRFVIRFSLLIAMILASRNNRLRYTEPHKQVAY